MTWYPCEFPERAPDVHTGWHMAQCRPCMIAAEARVRTHPKDVLAGLAARIQRLQASRGRVPLGYIDKNHPASGAKG